MPWSGYWGRACPHTGFRNRLHISSGPSSMLAPKSRRVRADAGPARLCSQLSGQPSTYETGSYNAPACCKSPTRGPSSRQDLGSGGRQWHWPRPSVTPCGSAAPNRLPVFRLRRLGSRRGCRAPWPGGLEGQGIDRGRLATDVDQRAVTAGAEGGWVGQGPARTAVNLNTEI
jgi:hypothetical protein